MNDAGTVWGALTFLVIIIVLYFLPAELAWHKPQFGSVLAINVFLGWTLVGWVIALAWAVKNEAPPQVFIHNMQQLRPILCSRCGQYSQPTSNFCDTCGKSFVRLVATQ